MEITFTSAEQPLLLNYPREFNSEKHLEERATVTSTGWGKLYLNECWFSGACVLCTEFKAKRQSTMRLQCDSFCWVMNFVQMGEITSDIAGHTMQLDEGRYNTFYCPALCVDLSFSQHTKVISICLTQRYISKLLGRHLLPEQFQSALKEPLTMVANNEHQPTRVAAIIKEITGAQQAPHIRRVFLEAKILELIYLQLEALEQTPQVPGSLSTEDIARLNDARKLIAADLRSPFTLMELARKTGLNDFKLKRGFKELFGTTVFGYLAELRMQTSLQLLEEGKPVSEVAEAVGYKNPHHFTAAFKKRFNILPSKVGVRPV